jgi:hypothetical protein
MHNLLILLSQHVVLDRICDEVGLLVNRRPFEHYTLIGIWRNILLATWILVSEIIVISFILLYVRGTWRAVFDYVGGHPLHPLIIKEAILVLVWLIIVKVLCMVFFATSIRQYSILNLFPTGKTIAQARWFHNVRFLHIKVWRRSSIRKPSSWFVDFISSPGLNKI